MEFIVSRYLAQASARHIGIGVDLELNERKLKERPQSRVSHWSIDSVISMHISVTDAFLPASRTDASRR